MTTALPRLVPVIWRHVIVVHVTEFVDVWNGQRWKGNEALDDSTPVHGVLEGLQLTLTVEGAASSTDRLDVLRFGARDHVADCLRLPFSRQTTVLLLVLANISACHSVGDLWTCMEQTQLRCRRRPTVYALHKYVYQ